MSNKMTAKSRAMLNQAHIQQVLAEPVRKAAEEQFARDHANDTDEGALCAAQGNEAQAGEKPQARENRRPAIL